MADFLQQTLGKKQRNPSPSLLPSTDPVNSLSELVTFPEARAPARSPGRAESAALLWMGVRLACVFFQQGKVSESPCSSV